MFEKLKTSICRILRCKNIDTKVEIDYSDINEEWYLKHRVLNQVNWYDRNSVKYKKLYYRFVVADIVLSALIPFMALFITVSSNAQYVIAFLGSVVTIISGIISTFQFQKKWTQYRTTSETLKHTQLLYLTKTVPYDHEDSFSIFVQNTELLISTENTNWAYYVQKNTKPYKKVDKV